MSWHGENAADCDTENILSCGLQGAAKGWDKVAQQLLPSVPSCLGAFGIETLQVTCGTCAAGLGAFLVK